LRRIAALLIALAEIAERAQTRCALVRWLVLWCLRPAQAAAAAYALDAAGASRSASPQRHTGWLVRQMAACFVQETGDDADGAYGEADPSAVDALPIARGLRALAAFFIALAHLARIAPAPSALPGRSVRRPDRQLTRNRRAVLPRPIDTS